MKFALLFTGLVTLATSAFSANPVQNDVPNFVSAYLTGKKLKFCTPIRVEHIAPTSAGFARDQYWSRRSSFQNFTTLQGGFSVDYHATVTSDFYEMGNDHGMYIESSEVFESTMRFEMAYNPAVDSYTGFARFVSQTRNGTTVPVVGRAYSVRMNVGADGLVVAASALAPSKRSDIGSNLALKTWSESFIWKNGVMERLWVERDRAFSAETWTVGEVISTSDSKERSGSCSAQ